MVIRGMVFYCYTNMNREWYGIIPWCFPCNSRFSGLDFKKVLDPISLHIYIYIPKMNGNHENAQWLNLKAHGSD